MPTRAPQWSIAVVWRPVGLEVENSMIIVGLAAIGATIVAALLLGLAWFAGRKQWPAPRAVALWVAPIWGITFVLNLVILYFDMPAFTGPWGGWQWLLWPLTLMSVYVIFGGSLTRARQSIDSLNGRLNSIPGGYSFSRRGSRRVVDQQPDGGIPGAARAGGLAIAGALIISVISLALNALTGNTRVSVQRRGPPGPPTPPGGGGGPVIDV